jgi:predicted AAA+ superfamily ATPase
MAQLDATINYRQRHLETALRTALEDTPVVCLLGARQCGKSTLALHLNPQRAYFSLDDAQYLDLAKNDPHGFVAELPGAVTIDEIQRAPELILAIKRSVDVNRQPGRFLLTGSANLLQLPTLSDSLAGRMECLYLHPFTEAEKAGSQGLFLRTWLEGKLSVELPGTRPHLPSDLPGRLVEGGYPEAFRRAPARTRQWLRQYLRSIIERDIQDVARIRDGSDLARLIELAAHRTGSLLNVTEMSSITGSTRRTVESHLSILERLFLIRLLPSWHRTATKRLVKTPKIHCVDCGLAAMLCGLESSGWLKERQRFGNLLESFILQQLIAQAGWTDPDLRFWHYRDKDQAEVDCIISRGSKIWAAEIKASRTVNKSDTRGLRRLAGNAGKDFQSGIVFYDGEGVLPIAGTPFMAVPISKLWEL